MSLRDPLGAMSRYVFGDSTLSPRLENVVKRVLGDVIFQVEQGRGANKDRKAEADARALEIRRDVDAEVRRDGITRTLARKRVAKAREKAGLPHHSFATVRNADKRAATLQRTGTPARKR